VGSGAVAGVGVAGAVFVGLPFAPRAVGVLGGTVDAVLADSRFAVDRALWKCLGIAGG